ncbi:MAG: hypothetical protein LUD18_08415, partial [Lachnospiraceae bacterium]|nr:hypothetical protein [Lachnospiraceae bacterium]
ALSRTGVNYLCIYGDADPTAQCHGFRVDAGTLENVVLQELKNHIQRFVSFSSCEKSCQTDLELTVSNQILCEKKLDLDKFV